MTKTLNHLMYYILFFMVASTGTLQFMGIGYWPSYSMIFPDSDLSADIANRWDQRFTILNTLKESRYFLLSK